MFALVSGRLVRDGCTLNGWGGHGRLGICSSFAPFFLVVLPAPPALPRSRPAQVGLALAVLVLVLWWGPRGAVAFLCPFLSVHAAALSPSPLSCLLCLRCRVWCWPVAVRMCPPWDVVGAEHYGMVYDVDEVPRMLPWFCPCLPSSLRPRSLHPLVHDLLSHRCGSYIRLHSTMRTGQGRATRRMAQRTCNKEFARRRCGCWGWGIAGRLGIWAGLVGGGGGNVVGGGTGEEEEDGLPPRSGRKPRLAVRPLSAWSVLARGCERLSFCACALRFLFVTVGAFGLVYHWACCLAFHCTLS